jgi:hypothetical protein
MVVSGHRGSKDEAAFGEDAAQRNRERNYQKNAAATMAFCKKPLFSPKAAIAPVVECAR